MFFAPLVARPAPGSRARDTLDQPAVSILAAQHVDAQARRWLEYVFNTPSAHRVHHASNVNYLDANCGGVLIVFDRLFGTYIEERAEEPCRYGLVTPTRSRTIRSWSNSSTG